MYTDSHMCTHSDSGMEANTQPHRQRCEGTKKHTQTQKNTHTHTTETHQNMYKDMTG